MDFKELNKVKQTNTEQSFKGEMVMENNKNNDTITNELIRQAAYVEKKNIVSGAEEMVSRSNKDYLALGIGAGGANAIHLAHRYNFTTCALNTSADDIKDIDADHIFIIDNAYGSGQNTKRAKLKFRDDADRFVEYCRDNFQEQRTVYVVGTCGGGTGAGLLAMTASLIKDNFPEKNVVIFAMLGSIHEDVNAQMNMRRVLDELLMTNLPYIVFDNGRSTAPIDKVFESVNTDVVTAMRALSREHMVPNTRSNIDLADMQSFFIHPKRMLVVSGNFDKKVSGQRDYEQQIIEAINNSVQIAPTFGKRISYGFILNVDESMYNDIDPNFRKVKSVFGESFSTFRHLQNKTTGPEFIVIITGLNDVVDRYKLINDRINEFNEVDENLDSISNVKKSEVLGYTPVEVVTPYEKTQGSKAIKDVSTAAFDKFMED